MTVVRIIHAPDRRALACQAAAALAGEGYGVLRAEPAQADGLARAAEIDLVLWSPELLQWPEALEAARRAFDARRLVPAALGAFAPPAPFAALQPVDLAGWAGAREDPRWRFVLDDIAIARKRGALADAPAAQETAPAREDGPKGAGEAAFTFADDPLKLADAVEETPFIFPIRTIMLSAGALAVAALAALILAPRPAGEQARPSAPRLAQTPDEESAPVLALVRPSGEGPAAEPAVRPAAGVAPPPLRESPLREAPIAVAAGADAPAAPDDPLTDELASSEAAAEEPAPSEATADGDDPPESPDPAGQDAEGRDEPEAPAPRLPPRPADDFLGVVFRDCLDCPDMAEIPGGVFRMGAPDDEPGRAETEGPTRMVAIAPFALSRREITRREWAACVDAGACPALESEPPDWADGRMRARLPVVGVSWEEAQRYAAWLSARTGRPYRLPSEAEWEYAARAGRATPYAFGAALRPEAANFAGALRAMEDPAATTRALLPAGAYPANAFGLFDMHGNVWEWVADCWTDSHAGAPEDGRARSWDCAARVLKGGGFASPAADLRAARRMSLEATARRPDAGFRVARDLP